MSHPNLKKSWPVTAFSPWRAVNTMQNQELERVVIIKMNEAVNNKYGIGPSNTEMAGISVISDAMGSEEFGGVIEAINGLASMPASDPITVVPEPEVFLLENDRAFKFGPGKSIVAFADGGKNKVGHPVKYVKWYNIYGDDSDTSKNKLKINEKTYTYGVDKAREFWNEKIKEGYNRVV